MSEKVVWISEMIGRDGKQVRTWRSGGRIMRQQPDSRQQPKSLAHKMVLHRMESEKFCCGPVPVERRESGLKFTRFGRGGALVSLADGRCIGVIKQTPSDEVLAASPGIQSWSRSGADNAPTDGHFEQR